MNIESISYYFIEWSNTQFLCFVYYYYRDASMNYVITLPFLTMCVPCLVWYYPQRNKCERDICPFSDMYIMNIIQKCKVIVTNTYTWQTIFTDTSNSIQLLQWTMYLFTIINIYRYIKMITCHSIFIHDL